MQMPRPQLPSPGGRHRTYRQGWWLPYGAARSTQPTWLQAWGRDTILLRALDNSGRERDLCKEVGVGQGLEHPAKATASLPPGQRVMGTSALHQALCDPLQT